MGGVDIALRLGLRITQARALIEARCVEHLQQSDVVRLIGATGQIERPARRIESRTLFAKQPRVVRQRVESVGHLGEGLQHHLLIGRARRIEIILGRALLRPQYAVVEERRGNAGTEVPGVVAGREQGMRREADLFDRRRQRDVGIELRRGDDPADASPAGRRPDARRDIESDERRPGGDAHRQDDEHRIVSAIKDAGYARGCGMQGNQRRRMNENP